MALQEYRRKRHFSQTPEPGPEVSASQTGRLYVIQKHAASHLHYDFRLEVGGVLKSWAVPKGPSLDPGEKRLAVHVEDHPVAYGSFEGVIPENEYGGGTVMLWDRGEWEPLGDPDEMYTRGRLKFRLHGKKLRGGWTLVRMAKREGTRENWLLMKERDSDARGRGEGDILEEKPLSVTTRRSLERIATDSDRVWSGNGQIPEARQSGEENQREEKAGRKTQAQRRTATAGSRGTRPVHKGSRKAKAGKGAGGRTARGRTRGAARPAAQAGPDPSRLTSARPAPQPAFIAPQLATLVKEVPPDRNWLHEVKFDGYRMLAMLEKGSVRLMTRREQDWTARFPRVVDALANLPIAEAVLDGELVVLRADGVSDFQAMQNAMRGGPRTNLIYYVFDLPHYGGYDLTQTPLRERKQLLHEVLQGEPAEGLIRYSDHILGQGRTVLQHACRLGLEGIMCKRADSPYESARTQTWLKVKCLRRQEFVIGGYTDPGGARAGFGALLLGYHDDHGRLRYCGKVGTGFDEKMLGSLHEQVAALETGRAPFFDPPRAAEARGVHWIKPKLVAEVAFTEWTNDNHLRHPSFQGLREDKVASEVVREEPQNMPTSRNDAPGGRTGAQTSVLSSIHHEVAGVRLTHPDRILYPEQNLTKSELADYYEQVAEWILPHVTRRPLTLVRCPEGHEGECFYQKHLGQHVPPALRGMPIEEKGRAHQYFVVDNLAGVISLVQMGVLEVHVWGSPEKDIEKPDRIVFDLDPGPGVEWQDLVKAAVFVRDVLADLKLTTFVKTTGGKGLHVVAPITPRQGWDEVKSFAKSVATAIARQDPSRYTSVMTKSKRSGRIFIDYLRNGRGATSIAAYSTRARPGAPVSTPVRWDELPKLTGAAQFTVRSLPRRLKTLQRDPWEDFLKLKQRLPT